MEEHNTTQASLIILISCTIINIVLALDNTQPINILNTETENKLYNNNSQCWNMTLSDTVSCIVSYTEPIYKYNKTDDKIKLTLDELKTRGGDCKDWSEYYIIELRKYNYIANPIIIEINETSQHEKVIVGDNTGYCDIDMLNYECYEYTYTQL